MQTNYYVTFIFVMEKMKKQKHEYVHDNKHAQNHITVI